MRYWTIVVTGLAVLAAGLPLAGLARTIIGDAQIVYALALAALLVRLLSRTFQAPKAGAPPLGSAGTTPQPPSASERD